MKNKYLFLLIICTLMIGCGGNNKASIDEKSNIIGQTIEETEINNVKEAEDETNHVKDKTPDNIEPKDDIKELDGFYGDYEIVACRGTSAVYAMSQEEIDATIGNTLSFRESTYAWNGNTMDTDYQEDIYFAEQMYEDFGIQASELGINGSEITLVNASTEGNFIGSHFYVLDDDTLLIYYEGVFFEAKRIESN
ncbi:MAG: hypothetical protein GX235_08055 [Clostridiales bacterium]|mgnify:CR=1 FL=1|nr:hypothetical protein [Clostridiales bacterium]